MKITIVLCYGLYQNQENYKNYLDNVLKDIYSDSPDKIIICGGFTNKNFPNISEARSVADYFLEKNLLLQDKIILEERSITTLQNIKFATEEILKLKEKVSSVIFVCDSIRLTKVFYLSSLLMTKMLGINANKEKIILELMRQVQNKKMDFTQDCQLEFENIIFKGIDMKRSLSEVGDQIPRSLIETISLDFPELEKDSLSFRLQEWDLKVD